MKITHPKNCSSHIPAGDLPRRRRLPLGAARRARVALPPRQRQGVFGLLVQLFSCYRYILLLLYNNNNIIPLLLLPIICRKSFN